MKINFNIGEAEGMVDNPCIQTKLKMLYNLKVTELLKKENITDEDSDEVELLKYALKNFNFSSLRRKCELNRVYSNNKVLIEKENNILTVAINNVQVYRENLKNGQ
jgi:hypothetical protein